MGFRYGLRYGFRYGLEGYESVKRIFTANKLFSVEGVFLTPRMKVHRRAPSSLFFFFGNITFVDIGFISYVASERVNLVG